jgi:crotonobetainyl-CoA:carnitine CoA-transferase CaiB-like acyl-CoA transferase
MFADPQLRHRGHFVNLEHPTLGHFTVEGPRPRLSRTPGQVRRSAPSIGQDYAHVLQTILGYGEDRVSELTLAGVFG